MPLQAPRGCSFEAWREEGDARDEKLHEAACRTRAFEHREEPWRCCHIADYCDQWFRSATCSFRTYCICRAGGAEVKWQCGAFILSDIWDRMIDDPMATGQRWYCKVCPAKYKTRYGVMVEIIVQGAAHYCVADIPPQHLQDAKFMSTQRRFRAMLSTMTSAEQLYNVAPRARPMDRGAFLTSRAVNDGVYTFNKPLFDQPPRFDRDILFQFKTEGQTRPGPAPSPTTAGDWDEAVRLALLPIEEV